MADERVVTELVIDARGAEAGSAAYVRAMGAAQAAVDRVLDREQAATAAIEKQTAVMVGSTGSITATARAWDRLKASADPAFRTTQMMEKALLTADAASRKLGVSEAERTRVLDQVRLKTDAAAAAAEAQAQSYRELAAAGREALAAEQAQASINRTLGIGNIGAGSARASASVFAAELDRFDEIAAQKAQQAGQTFGIDLDRSLVAGTTKSARDAASVFAAELDRVEDVARLKAAQIGAAFQSDLNTSFGIGAGGSSARASASIFEEAGREADLMASKVAALRAELNPLAAAQERANAELAEYAVMAQRGAISAEELAAAQTLVKTRFDIASAAIGRGSKLASFEMRNLQFQMIDIAQSIPLAFQSPLYFLQNMGFQVAQIGQIFMGRGGFAAAIGEIGGMLGGMLSRVARFGAGIAVGALGFEAIRDAASEAENRTVGFGETGLAIFQTLGSYIRGQFGPAIDAVGSTFGYVFEKLGSAAVDIAELVINAFRAAFHDITVLWNTFPDVLGAAFVGAANTAITALNYLVKKSSDAVDSIITALNRISGSDVPLLNASDQTVAPLDNQYLENLKKAVADRNAAIEEIMSSTPLRDFADDVVEKIQTNHALEGLEALGNVSFDKSIGGANGLGSAIGGVGKAASGVSVQIGGVGQEVINVTRAFEDAKRAQLIGLEQSSQQLQTMKNQAEDIQKTLDVASQASVTDVFGDAFSGDADAASDAIDRTVTSIDRLFSALDTGNVSIGSLHESLDLIRESMKQLGGDPRAIDAFINKIINGELKVRDLRSGVDNLSASIKNIPNKTVTITVVTKQVGSGTQSLYDVPNQSGGTSTVGVTRYGGVAGEQSGPSITSNSVPRTGGYGSMGGSGNPGSTTVNVTRFATGGMIHPGDTQRVSFFKSPEETVGIFTPNQVDALQGGLADPQSAFTGRDATREQDRLWTVLMNIEANTRKTFEGIDKLASSGYGSSSGSSYDGSSSSSSVSEDDALSARYRRVLASVKANFHAAGIVGSGITGYGLQGLNASPETIARNIVYGGQSPLGSAGATSYERSSAINQNYAMRSVFRGQNVGFDSGGMIAPGDTQKVEFFKNPNERVIVARPDQFEDRRSGSSNSSGGDRPIQFSQVNRWEGSAPPSRESLAEIRRATALGIQDALRSIRGR
ncbi:hypothetical protein [Mesorhizobium sp. M6A.T.Ce.TU.016.01.1.1]|uniref:hypothetical protein n=1 Tax=Mesorhizobium sp. M6A.T.Ce.TU.016.01.1.1 TaxID=2496783 RepID=UPI000FCCBF1A|nr:hypothetical protein [Mesorhizobium sp. M6A.T.Ce.TU.016.01.1.1]RUU29769.1 hypothetical protein EOC94_12950 [Mesorhizobium sp. M6A.T.Ce.TU.016.01.1.1]